MVSNGSAFRFDPSVFGRPVIFVSAVSKELRDARDLVAKTLTGLGYEPKWQDIAPTETGDLRDVLRKWVDDSAAVIQLVAHCYGFEPPTPHPEFGRVSYTQFEALYARSRGKKVWYIVLAPEHPTESVEDEPDELRQLQEAYRARVTSDGHLYHQSASLDQTKLIVRDLDDKLKWLRLGWKLWAAAILALLVVALVSVWLVKKDTGKVAHQTEQIVAGQSDLAGQLSQVQEALARIQQNSDPARDPISQWSQERLENELARQLQINEKDLRAILTAGKTSLDALLQGQALLASGKTQEAGEQFDVVIEQEKDAMTRLRQAYEGKAQIAFAAVRYEEALQFGEKAAAFVDKTADPLGWADTKEWVALSEFELARYEQAEQIMKEIVRMREQVLGADVAELIPALNNLARLYQETKRLVEAEPLMERALKLSEKSFGPEHPNVARVLNNLAQLYRDMDRFAEAEPLMERALKIDEKNFGQEHPELAKIINNLALLYQKTNRPAEAELLMERALKIAEKSFGPEHSEVARVLSNLAQFYAATNRLAQAEPLMKRALKIDEKSFGPEHPRVGGHLNNLAQLYKNTNRLGEAEPLMEQALKVDEKTFGRDHPSVARDLNNLARLYHAMNRTPEAENLFKRALKINEQTYGVEHSDVAIILNNLALLYQDTNRPTEAEPLLERALKIDQKSFGPDHPTVAIRLNNLARSYWETNQLAEAEPLMRRCIVILMKFTRDTGYPHPHLSKVIDNYKQLLIDMDVPEPEIQQRLAAARDDAGLPPEDSR